MVSQESKRTDSSIFDQAPMSQRERDIESESQDPMFGRPYWSRCRSFPLASKSGSMLEEHAEARFRYMSRCVCAKVDASDMQKEGTRDPRDLACHQPVQASLACYSFAPYPTLEAQLTLTADSFLGRFSYFKNTPNRSSILQGSVL